MTDTVSSNIRSQIMRAIKSSGTNIENKAARELWKRGFRFRRNVKSLYGKPDMAIKKYKVVIFIDSCFWHNCPIHGHHPKSNTSYWDLKLKRNIIRDENVNAYYLKNKWNIIRIWEHSLLSNYEETIKEIVNFLLASIGGNMFK
jgi:DNA mismatch endonuclease (patch repair protein)